MAFKAGTWVPSVSANGDDQHPNEVRDRQNRTRAGREELAKQKKAGREYEVRKKGRSR